MLEMLTSSRASSSGLPGGFAIKALPQDGPSGREGMGMLVSAGKIYILGGSNTANLVDRWVYDIATETWSRLSGDLPWNYTTTCKVSISGARFSLIGSGNTSVSAYLWNPTDPATYVNQYNTNQPKGMGTCGIYLPATSLYYAHGASNASTANLFEQVNPVTGGSSSYLNPISASKITGAQMTVWNGAIYVGGGYLGTLGAGAAPLTSGLYLYDRIGNTWAAAAAAFDPRTGCVLEGVSTAIYRHGGRNIANAESVDNYTDKLLSFTTTDGWKEIGPTGHTHQNGQSVVYNGKIYVFGGKTYDSVLGFQYTNKFTEITVPA